MHTFTKYLSWIFEDFFNLFNFFFALRVFIPRKSENLIPLLFKSAKICSGSQC